MMKSQEVNLNECKTILRRHLKWLNGYTNNEFEIESTRQAIKELS